MHIAIAVDIKVVFDGKFGNMEFKCSVEYGTVDQKSVCFTSENFFVVFADITHKICINKIKDNELNSNAANFDNTIMV